MKPILVSRDHYLLYEYQKWSERLIRKNIPPSMSDFKELFEIRGQPWEALMTETGILIRTATVCPGLLMSILAVISPNATIEWQLLTREAEKTT